MKKDTHVAIVTVKFKARNTCSSSVVKWKPATFTYRFCYLCLKYDEKEVLFRARDKATELAKKLESENEGLMVIFTATVEAIRVYSVEVLERS